MGYSLNQASNTCEASVNPAAPLQEQWTSERAPLTSTGGRGAFMFLISVYLCNCMYLRLPFPQVCMELRGLYPKLHHEQ